MYKEAEARLRLTTRVPGSSSSSVSRSSSRSLEPFKKPARAARGGAVGSEPSPHGNADAASSLLLSDPIDGQVTRRGKLDFASHTTADSSSPTFALTSTSWEREEEEEFSPADATAVTTTEERSTGQQGEATNTEETSSDTVPRRYPAPPPPPRETAGKRQRVLGEPDPLLVSLRTFTT